MRVNAPKRHSTGFTLVELLVVIAIVALVAGIAVPGMARLMGYGRNNIDNAARDVYTLLRAANVYASTFRVNTAVVYTVRTASDSVFNAPAMVVNGIGMARARAFSEEELAQLTSEGEDATVISRIRENPDSVYVLVLSEEGQLRKLPNYSCIQSASSDMSVLELAANPIEFGERMTDRGMRSIILYNEDRIADDLTGAMTSRFTRIAPDLGTEFAGSPALPQAFPAHVFSPVGIMVTPDTLGARFVLPVGSAPDSDPEDRFVNLDDLSQGPIAPINIELYPATGRVKIAS